MNKYYYFANTWRDDKPIQVEGYIKAENEEVAIHKLIDDGIVDSRSYEFLDLYVV